MQILVTAATEMEVAPFTNANVDILITGIGVPATLYHLQKKLHQVNYDFVMGVGIAGAFTHQLSLGQVVLVKQDIFGDLGTEEKNLFTPIFQSGLMNADEHPFKNGWLVNDFTAPKNYDSFDWVNAVTVNKVSDSILQKQQIQNTFNPQIETMEGAALHYVCLQQNVSFLQVRAVSNYVGERNKVNWKIKEAVENLNKELSTLINQFT